MDLGKWRGLFDWSMRYADATSGSNFTEMPAEKRAWLMDALQHYMQDFADRMKEIKAALDNGNAGEGCAAAGSSLEEKEALLEELMDIVSSIDFARDLHKIGGLPTLLTLLQCPHPSLRWRAAEVVATCVQNNPPVQQWFMEGGVMPALHALLQDDDVTCRTKALLAVSGMVRHFAPAREEFLSHQGMNQLVDCATAQDSRLSRKALGLLHYFCHKEARLGLLARDSGVVPAMVHNLDRDTSDMRQAGLEVLLDLARIPGAWDTLKETEGLQDKLQQLQHNFQQLPTDDQEAEQDEHETCSTLQEALKQPPASCPVADNDDVLPSTSADPSQRHTQSIGVQQDTESSSGQGGSATGGLVQPAQPSAGTVTQQPQQAQQQPQQQQANSDSGAAAASWGLVHVPAYDPR